MRGGEHLAASTTSFAGDALTPIATFAGKKATASLLASFMKLPRDTRVQFLSRVGGGNPIAGKSKLTSAMKAASIILWTITVVEILELTTGFGPPDEGDDLKAGAQQFDTLSEQLKAALPEDNWRGSASDAYANLDTSLQDLAQTMAGLDLQMTDLVENQAEWVTHMRLAFGILKDVLLAAFVIEIVMTFLPPPAGPVPARAFALTVSGLGIAAATSFLATLCTYSFENAKKADALTSQYTQAASGAVQTGSLAQAKVASTGESSVSSFEAVSASMSGMPAVTAAPVPAVAAPVKPRNGADDERAPASTQMSAADTGVGATADAPTTPDQTTPSTPAAAMPTLAQVSAMSGQTSKLSGQLSQHSQLVNQAMGQIQQLTQMAQQGQGAAAPAEKAALTSDVEGAEAGLGTDGAQRAPIEAAAASTEHASEPGPVARIV
ncbi:EspA/EspE family type VII secretion system effector [Mycobacterium nebraskense]|nr:EspA/EspE family type VII secretion system effector [Mycobacterium nebraskense]